MAEANLKIMAYDKPGGNTKQNEIKEFYVDFNPSTFTISNKIDYEKNQEKGKEGGDPVFEKVPPLEFSLEFTIDGTGVAAANLHKDNKGDFNAKKHDYVKTQIVKLREVTGVNGEIHRPNYLALLWGNIYIKCVLTSLNITYNLFDIEGAPLRAKVTCSFLERKGPGEGERETRLESPDLTKYKYIKEGDTLPLIAKRNYENSAYYMQLAKVNKLRNFRNIIPGTTLILPPMSDSDE